MKAFNIADLQDQDQDFSPLSNGSHRVKIVTSDDRPNQAQTGRYVLVEFKVLDGPEAGKRVRDYCTHQHPNPKAVAAGLGRLKKIMLACGLESIEDETDLLNQKLNVVTEIEEPEEGSSFKPQARVRRYEPLSELPEGSDDTEAEEGGEAPF